MDGPTTGTAWLVCGAPGSGKTVLGRALATAIGAVLADQDTVCGPLTRVVAHLVDADEDDLDDPAVRDALGTAPYDALLDTAADNLRLGHEVVLVAPFTRLLGTVEGLAHLHRLGPADRRVVWAHCPADERHRRLAARGAARDRRKLLTPSSIMSIPVRPPVVPHRAVNTTTPLDAQVSAAMEAPVVPAGEVGDQRR